MPTGQNQPASSSGLRTPQATLPCDRRPADAGIDGVRRRLDPTSLGFGPFDEDVFSWPSERRARIQALPTSLDEALDALERDHAFLLEGGVFNKEMIDRVIKSGEPRKGPSGTAPIPTRSRCTTTCDRVAAR